MAERIADMIFFFFFLFFRNV